MILQSYVLNIFELIIMDKFTALSTLKTVKTVIIYNILWSKGYDEEYTNS